MPACTYRLQVPAVVRLHHAEPTHYGGDATAFCSRPEHSRGGEPLVGVARLIDPGLLVEIEATTIVESGTTDGLNDGNDAK